ncbi:MAG TPA: hypothetical protein DFK11_06305 [Lachnospiraceae bacterium]|nr:hypothetical protein [Lachnospiraceae bacterium]
MDKYEYKLRSDEIVKLIEEEKYVEAANIADMIDWRRVKSITMLLKVSALYRVNRRNEDSKAVLQIAYERYPANRAVLYSLCEVSVELDDVVAAIEYYKEFVKLAPRDNGVFTLRYRILEAQEASLEERIELLEELKKRDYQEEWAYELAYLYHRVGLATKCVEECDDLILWFGDGPYVMKAMELKMLHAPLTPIQQKKYDMAKARQSQEDYAAGDTYSEENYSEEESYAEDGYGAEDAYPEENYSGEESYPEDGYGAEDVYPEENYSEEESYAEDGYGVEDAYPEENYNEEPYSEDDYRTEEIYTEDTYLADNAEVDNIDNYAVEENQSVSSAYRDTGSIDMSQYNTINLQKVVAESMKELFADDEDIFAEERADIVQPEDIHQKNATETEASNPSVEDNTLIQEDHEELPQSEPETTEKEQPVPVHTSRVAQMVTGVSEIAPEPHTGAISKVFVPGEDARVIRQDTDMDMLRDITEESVQEEHDRLEENGENVFDEQPTLQEEIASIPVPEEEVADAVQEEEQDTQEEVFHPMTGQMNLDEVLGEWERMKQENAAKHKEEVRKLVLRQTGKIFENFDNSIKNGIFGELEKEDEGEVEELTEIEDTPDMVETELQEEITESQVWIDEENETESVELSDVEESMEESVKESYEEQSFAQEEDDKQEYTEEEYGQEYAESGEEIEEAAPEQEEYAKEESVDDDAQAEYSEEIPETQEIDMDTAEIGDLPDKIIETTDKETKGVRKEEIRDFTPEEQELFENYAVTKKIRKQIIYALDKMSLAAYTGNVIITGEAGLGTVRLAKNLIREYQALDANFSGKVAKITGEKLNLRNLSEVFVKLGNGALIIEKANGITQDKLYEMANLLNQDNLGLVVIMEDTRKEITHLLEKQAFISDYFNIRIDLMEMDNNALVDYAKNYALALEYSIDELGTLALYTRIANSQSGNHVVTKDEVRDIIDEAIWKSKKFNLKNFVDVLLAKRYDKEDMIVLRERDFM